MKVKFTLYSVRMDCVCFVVEGKVNKDYLI